MRDYDTITKKIQDAFMKIFSEKELHEITVKSVLGEGTVFTVRLPV